MKGYLAVMVIAIAVLFTQINWYYYFDEAVHFTPAIKAVVFGLMGATAVLVSMLPKSTDEKGNPARFEEKLVLLAGAAPAGLSGWYSLVAVAGGEPIPYILPLVLQRRLT